MMKKFGFGNLGSPLAVLLLLSLFVLGCRKDGLLTTDESPGLHQNRQKISINEARQFFENQYSAFSGFTDSAYAMVKVEPDWDWAFISHSISGNEIAVVPLKDTLLRHMNEGRAGAKLIFQKIGGDSILANVLVYCADSTYYAANAGSMQFGNFTGSYLFFDIGMNFEHGVYVENGSPLGRVMSLESEAISTVSAEDRIDCYTRQITITHPCYLLYSQIAMCETRINITICANETGDPLDPINPYLPPMGGGGGAGGGQSNPPSGGGSSGSNNPPVEIPYQTFWDIFMGNIPINILMNFGDELPSGEWELDTALMRKFISIHQVLHFIPDQLRWMAYNPSVIPIIHQAIYNPAGEESAKVKNVLNFVMAHGLSAGAFVALFQNETLFQQVKVLAEVLNLNKEELDLLISQPLFVTQVSDFRQAHQGDNVAELFTDYMIQELSMDPSIPKDTDLSQYNFFDNFEPVINYLESNTESEDEFDNGIELDYIVQAPPSPPSAGRLLGGAPANPNGGQDAIGRTNGDLNILPTYLRTYDIEPEFLLKFRMRLLFFLATNSDQEEILDGMGDAVRNAYLSRFFSNKNGTFHPYQNSTLHQMVKDSPKFKAWLKKYGSELNQQLKLTNGNITAVNNVGLARTALNDTKSLTILINDTQKTDVYIVEDQYDFHLLSGDWEAVIRVNITDNFGVDDGDVTEFWNHVPGGPGFTSWWMLQHRKNYWPFKTDLWFTVKIKGNIND